MKIFAKATIDGKSVDCKGVIEIHWRNEPQAYVSWKIFTPHEIIVSRSDNFYYKESKNSEEELKNRIREKILSYRIGRKRVFEDVKFLEE